jgi:hypothetical protein
MNAWSGVRVKESQLPTVIAFYGHFIVGWCLILTSISHFEALPHGEVSDFVGIILSVGFCPPATENPSKQLHAKGRRTSCLYLCL